MMYGPVTPSGLSNSYTGLATSSPTLNEIEIVAVCTPYHYRPFVMSLVVSYQQLAKKQQATSMKQC
jgi:hypothetical protein